MLIAHSRDSRVEQDSKPEKKRKSVGNSHKNLIWSKSECVRTVDGRNKNLIMVDQKRTLECH